MYSTSDFRKGLAIIYEGQPYIITEVHHHKPGKGAAVVRTKMRNLLTGVAADPTFRSGDKVARADLEEKEGQYLYESDGNYHFMDPETYEQYQVGASVIDDKKNFMMENMNVQMLFFEGRIISIEIPNHVVLQIIECAPAVRGDTVSGATKPAKVTTGYSCQVPLFVNEGDKIRIDTRTGLYIERA
ncbi:MAG: elongation factor P [Myxococcales bacterium]|nr:elongation factor P [Myxococcales bacterium]USN51551.1 MAG: elongation factor P [Myxococcales bacterium]